jgi:primase-polymerase (primpol)-like protein
VFSREAGFVFIDLDHVLDPETGAPKPQAADLVAHFRGTYMERSQSGKGLHIICRGRVSRSFKRSDLGLEVYDDKRFCAMTGNGNGLDAVPCQEALDYLMATYAPPEGSALRPRTMPELPGSLSDEEIVSHILRKGQRGALLWEGRYQEAGYASQSEADAALCTVLCFWADGNYDTIDRLFRQSGLSRRKWTDRADYRRRTIEGARGICRETFSEWKARRDREGGKRYARAIQRRR